MKDILMGRSNPEGVPLEQVLSQLIKEVAVKCSYIACDETSPANNVLQHNLGIMESLQTARELQITSMELLDSISKEHDVNDESTYRIGVARNYKGAEYDV